MISRKATTQPIPVYPVDVVLPFFIWVVLEFSKLYLFADFDTFTIYFTCWVTGGITICSLEANVMRIVWQLDYASIMSRPLLCVCTTVI